MKRYLIGAVAATIFLLALFGAYLLGRSSGSDRGTVESESAPVDSNGVVSLEPTPRGLDLRLPARTSRTDASLPKYDGSGCDPYPTPVIEREWQVAAPRGLPGKVLPGESIQIGLRNKFGAEDEFHYVAARVAHPDGTSTTRSTLLQGSKWAYAVFPEDFPGAEPLQVGTYTILWESEGGFIACDGVVGLNRSEVTTRRTIS